MQQVEKASKHFQINDDALVFPHSVHKQLRLPKNMQAMCEPIQKQCPEYPKPKSSHNKDMAIPYEMSQTFIKYMLFYRMVAYLIALSVLLSIISVYGGPQDDILIIANNGITICILTSYLIKLKFQIDHTQSKKQHGNTVSKLRVFAELATLIPHPTLWTQDHNHYFHLAIMVRVLILLKFLIYSSIYCDVRAYRIIKINGLNASEHFLFAIKSLVQSLNFLQIFAIELLSVLFFTHCLYLVSMNCETALALIDCFQVVMITMPTVGFGEYFLPEFGQKIILFLTVINGAVLNSFITLSMLSNLQMNQNELSSYLLMKKIQAREHIQFISKSYIQKSFTIIRKKDADNPETKDHINFSFRHQYRLRKSLYNSISYTDINNLFGYFRDRLIQMRVSSCQTANMISVLVRSLQRYNMKAKMKEKGQFINFNK